MQNMLIKAILVAVMFPAIAFAQDEKPYPLDPLAVWVRTVYPEDITTVGEAVQYLLEPTGYKVVGATQLLAMQLRSSTAVYLQLQKFTGQCRLWMLCNC